MTGFRSIGHEPITVLNVDDDPAFSDLVATFLERLDDGIEVTTVESPSAAVDVIDDRDVDCVVSDFDMPEFTGLELLESVRATDPNLPFILFTGKGSEEIASKAISAGVTDYLQKESGTEQYEILANRIRNAVTGTQANREMNRAFEVIDAAQEGVALLDDDGTFLYVNDTYSDITGYDRTELVGEHWKTLAPEDGIEHYQEEVRPLLTEHGHWQGETTYVREDGNHVVVDHVLSYTADDTMICLIDDAFGSGAHGMPRGGDRLLDEALDAMDDIFLVVDAEGALVRANQRLAEVTGYSIDEIYDMDRIELVADEDVENVEAYLEERGDSERTMLQASLCTGDGGTIPYEFRTRAITDTHGTVIGYVAIGRDVSEQHRRERRLESQTAQLETFAEVLAHDLRNPLAVATGRVSEALETGSVDQLDAAADALANLDNAIGGLADVMREGTIVDSTSWVSLGNAFEDAKSSVAFDGHLSVSANLTVEADHCALTRLAENLLSNVAEHAGPAATVHVGRTQDGFFVADDGPGIPEEERSNVFDPGHTSKADEGGFGLVSVRQIAVAHGWTVQVTETPDGGARFEFGDVDVGGGTADPEPADSAT